MADIPPSLKALAPFLRLSKQFEQRDLVVSYFCQLYFVQNGIKLASKDDEGKKFLFGVMDKLEQVKGQLIAAEDEAVNNEIVALAHIENKALQLFLFADKEDRNSNFDTKVIKTFYTSSLLFELLTVFGELSEESAHHKKYAQWKATYLEKCRRSGEQPVPGPELHDEEQQGELAAAGAYPPSSYNLQPIEQQSEPIQQPIQQPYYPPDACTAQIFQPAPPMMALPTKPPPPQASPQQFPPTPQQQYQPPPQQQYQPPPQQQAQSAVPGELLQFPLNVHQNISFQQIGQIQKLCRYASSALNYQDIPTCLDNLQRAMNIVRCGREQ